MGKSKGRLTYGQVAREYKRVWGLYLKLRSDYNSLRVAHNKLLKQKETVDGER